MTSIRSNEERRQYREWMNRSIGLGTIGFISAVAAAIFAPENASDPFLIAGVGLYYLGILGYLGIWGITGVRLFDERERQIERKTGYVVMIIVLIVTIFGVPADLILDTTGLITLPSVFRGVIWGYAAFAFVGLFVYEYVEKQHS